MAADLAVYPDAAVIVPPEGLGPTGFVQLPRAVLFRPGLSDGAKLLFAALLSYAWGDGACWPGQARLAADLGVTERTVRRRLAELQEHGLLAVRQRGQGRTNVYLLLCPDEAPPRQECRVKTRQECPVKTGQNCPVRTTLDVDPVELAPPPPPPPPPPPTDRQPEEEDPSAHADDGTGTAPLVAAGATPEQASELAALGATPEQVQTVLTDAWRQTAARARERELRCPDRYRRACVRNGAEALLWRLRDAPERAPANEVGEKLAAEEARQREEFAARRERFDALPEGEQARLIDEARRRVPILRDRPPDHPAVIGAAVNLLGEGVTA